MKTFDKFISNSIYGNSILIFDDLSYWDYKIKPTLFKKICNFFKCKRNPSKYINIKTRIIETRKQLGYIDKYKYEYLKSE